MGLITSSIFGSIRFKIFVGMALMSILFILLSVGIMNAFLDRIIDEELGTSLDKSRRAFEQYSALSDELLMRQVIAIARAPYLKATVGIPSVDHETLLFTAQELHKEVAGSDLFLLLDGRAALLVDVAQSNQSGVSLKDNPGVTAALAGRSNAQFWSYNGRLYRVAVAPIEAGERQLGLLAIGNLISSPEAAARFVEISGSNVLLLKDGIMLLEARYKSAKLSVTDEEAGRIQSVQSVTSGDARAAALPLHVVLGGKASLATALPLGTSGGVLVLFRSLDEIADKVTPIRNVLFVAGGVSVLLAVIFSLWLTRRVTNPILQLKNVVEKFGMGHLEKRAENLPTDEIGLLGSSFNQMAEDLKQTTVSRDYFDNILASMIDTLVVVTPDGRIAMVNEAAGRLLEYSTADLIGRPLESVLARKDPHEETVPLVEWMGACVGRTAEAMYITRAGETIPVSISASPLKEESGRLDGFICVAQDMREFLKLQAEKLRAEKLAALGSMAAIMAHEIKNRLAVIAGASDVLQMGLQSSAAGAAPRPAISSQDLATVHDHLHGEIRRATGLINDVLMFAKPTKPELAPVDIRALIVNVLSQKAAALRQNRIAVSVGLFPARYSILADARQMEQVFTNIIQNAIEAQPKGGSILVTGECRWGEKPWLHVEIADTGSGIDEKVKKSLFEPFFTTKEFGIGLGLAVCRSLIQEHRGTCSVLSETDKPTRVLIELPLIMEETSREGD